MNPYHGGHTFPLTSVDDVVVNIILMMARVRQCLNPSKGLATVNSLIKTNHFNKISSIGNKDIIMMEMERFILHTGEHPRRGTSLELLVSEVKNIHWTAKMDNICNFFRYVQAHTS